MNAPTNPPDLPLRCKTLWGATEPPFGDHVKKPFAAPAFLDLTARLEQLVGVRASGVVHGPNGVGKTLAVEHFLRALPDKRFQTILISHSSVTGTDLLRLLCTELGRSPRMRRADNLQEIRQACLPCRHRQACLPCRHRQACLRQFPVHRTGPVLIFPAEDSLAVVRQRLEGICAAAAVSFDSLPVHVITAPTLRLDTATDCQRLAQTIENLHPRLLILDPLIRLHRVDENDASQIAALLSYLRQLQRQFHLAVLLVHHARKDSHSSRPGQALRGSSELHGWGDSNLYLRRRGEALTLSTEHRAAPSLNHIPLQLTALGSTLALSVLAEGLLPIPNSQSSALERVRQALAQLNQPASVQQLRKLCGIRTATLCSCLAELSQQGQVIRDDRGYHLKLPFEDPPVSLSHPIDPRGNGNGKHPVRSPP